MSSSSRGPRRNSSVQLPIWALLLLVGLGLLILILSSVWLFRTVRGMASTPGSGGPDFVPGVQQTRTDPRAPEVLSETAATPAGEVSPDTIPDWAGTKRVNILLLGVDLRCDEEGPTHSDTIIVTSIDPVSRSAVMLSLPRDLWVEIPNNGVARINQAFFLGEAYEYPGGGPALAVETVEAFLGINIDYYVAVNFQAVIDFVNLMGGIVVDVPERIVDETYPDNCYGYDPFTIEAGRQRLDGEIALKYARTRATFGGDIDRANRQQEVILATRKQATQLDTLPQLLFRAPQLWQSFRTNVDTNMDFDTALQLANLLRNIPEDNIRNVVLDYNYVENNTTFDGQQVLVPYRDQVRALRDELFAPPAVPTPVIEALPTVITVENARVGIYNGTSVFGLAADTRDYLRRRGIVVTDVGNADSANYTAHQIIDYGSHPGTVQQLIQLLGVPPLNVSTGTNPEGDFDILVILGGDWTPPQATQP
ncbi:MAG: LCP family protein [Anaerolineae bacterium]|nr:LCP family protein [Anaerolineae bacterium]HNS39264.1 LCP family protein [Promineifilum sp.]